MMFLFDTPKPKKDTRLYRFCEWFVNNINWCEGYYYGSDKPKPNNKVYDFFYTYWLFPFKQNDCICCNTVRGLIYGLIMGYVLWH